MHILILTVVCLVIGFIIGRELGSDRAHVKSLSLALQKAREENTRLAVQLDNALDDWRLEAVQNGRLTKRLAEARKSRDEARARAHFWHHEHIDYATKVNRDLNSALTDLGEARRVQRNTDAQIKSARTALNSYRVHDTDPAPAPASSKSRACPTFLVTGTDD